MNLSDVVTVTLVVQDRVPASANFGVPLLLGHLPAAKSLAAFGAAQSFSADLSGLSALATALGTGYASTWIYSEFQTIISQQPHCGTVVVAPRPHIAGKKVRIALGGTPVEGSTVVAHIYKDGIEVAGSPVTATADGTPLLSEMAGLLVSGIQALADANATIGEAGGTWLEVVPATSTDKLYCTATPSAGVTAAVLDLYQDLEVTVSAPAGVGERYAINVSIGNAAATECEYVSILEDAEADILDALYTDLVAAGCDVTKVGATTTSLKIRSGLATTRVAFSGWGYTANVFVTDNSLDAGIGDDLDAAEASGLDFFGVLYDSNAATEITQAAAWVEAAEKLSLAITTDADAVDATETTTNILTVLSGANRARTGVFATRDTQGRIDGALMGRQFALNPGSSTYALKTLSGPTADSWSSTQSGAITAKHGLEYGTVRSLALTSNGWAASGRFLDITHGNSWLKYQLEQSIVIMAANAEKVPNDATGRAMVKSALSSPMAVAEANKLVSPGWIVNVPATTDVTNTTENRIARILAGVTIDCTLLGALHHFEVAGTETL